MLRSFWCDLGTFIFGLAGDWIFWMSGSLGLIWTIATLAKPGAAVWLYEALCVIALFVSCFRVWRKAYREARPYAEETFRSVKRKFDGLGEEYQKHLKQLLIDKRDSYFGQLVPSKMLGFVIADPASGMACIAPVYEPMLARLFKEQEARERRHFKLGRLH